MRGEALHEAELCARVTQKLASCGTRTRQIKHDSKMKSPHANLMTGQTTLGAWRKAVPPTVHTAATYVRRAVGRSSPFRFPTHSPKALLVLRLLLTWPSLP